MIDQEELKKIIREAVSEAGHCQFNERERVAIRALSEIDPNVLSRIAKIYSDATNHVIKGLLAVAFFGALCFAAVGAYFKFGK